MKNSLYIIAIISCILILSCNNTKSLVSNKGETAVIQNDTVRIANDTLQYEVIIIDPGFNSWLLTNAHFRGYHSQSYLESKNQLYILEWNSRVLQPQRFDPRLYEMTINYDPTVDYGYEVNYLIYNYMIYFQNTNKQQLSGYVPLR